MNARIKRKYTKWNCDCVHRKSFMAYYGDVAYICTARNENCTFNCDCKEYKPMRTSIMQRRFAKMCDKWCEDNNINNHSDGKETEIT